ncbi:MAG: hypothetical protein AAFV95_19765 [Bacteroidota bacterium]
MIKSLEEVLQYQSRDVLHRFGFYHPQWKEQAAMFFDDLKRFLWLYATVEEQRKTDPEAPDVLISGYMLILDEIWHCFILYTEHYQQFCEDYLGRFVHHPPKLYKYYRNKEKLGEEAADEIMVEEMIGLVVAYFGEETALRWFEGYEAYVPENAIH